MFTGIVQDSGTVDRISRLKDHLIMRVRASFKDGGMREGESVNVNGACLTVERAEGDVFEAHVSRETLQRTNLSSLKRGDRVNLERAMEAGDRFGGHIVQGHIDATGIVRRIGRCGEGTILRITYPSSLEGLFVEKGSVCLNGVSLTISGLGRGWIEVTIVPYTLKSSNLSMLKAGDRMNIEADIIGKYIKKFQEMKR